MRFASKLTTLLIVQIVAMGLIVTGAPASSDAIVALEAQDRVGAAIEWSRLAEEDHFGGRVLLAHRSFPGITYLSGGLQTRFDAPLLLTPRNRLAPRVLAELERIAASSVIILGSTRGVSSAVERDLRRRGYGVLRLSVTDKLTTAAGLAHSFFPSANTGILTRLYDDTDRMMRSVITVPALAAELEAPVLLTRHRGLGRTAQRYLDRSLIELMYIIGDRGDVSRAVAQQVRSYGIVVRRIAAEDAAALTVKLAQQVWEPKIGHAPDCFVLEAGLRAGSWASLFPAAHYGEKLDCPPLLVDVVDRSPAPASRTTSQEDPGNEEEECVIPQETMDYLDSIFTEDSVFTLGPFTDNCVEDLLAERFGSGPAPTPTATASPSPSASVPPPATGGGGGGGEPVLDRLLEDFEEVTPPALPAGWTTLDSGAGEPWATTPEHHWFGANGAAVNLPPRTSDHRLISPAFRAPAATDNQLRFWHELHTEERGVTDVCDGGVLEISIEGGPFEDILAAGGSFVRDGYNATISPACASTNPLGQRAVWGGDPHSSSVVVNLPEAAAGRVVRLSWRFASDDTDQEFGTPGALRGWMVDHIIVGNRAPTAVLISTTDSGTAPLRVVFDGSGSSDEDDGLAKWTLDFGDGSPPASGSGAVPAALPHTYSAEGTYVAELTVTDTKGATDVDTRTITVRRLEHNQSPEAVLEAAPQHGPCGSYGVDPTFDPSPTQSSTSRRWRFRASNSSDPETPTTFLMWSIDFGDGTSAGGNGPPSDICHVYGVGDGDTYVSTEETYTVTLTITDDHGGTDTDSITITITPPPE